MARTENVCVMPRARSESTVGLVQAANAPWSSLHSKVAGVFVDMNANVAVVDALVSAART